MATLSATGQEKIQKGFYPLVSGFQYLAYNDFASLDLLAELKPAAVLLELIQGEGGVIPADPEWVKKLEIICKENDILLMVDEIQTGMGRTGTLFSYEQYDIEPDVISISQRPRLRIANWCNYCEGKESPKHLTRKPWQYIWRKSTCNCSRGGNSYSYCFEQFITSRK